MSEAPAPTAVISPSPVHVRAQPKALPDRPPPRRNRVPVTSTSDTCLRLRPTIAAPSLARNRARWVCDGRGLGDDLVRDVAFIAGELVAISVRQVRAPLDLDICIEQTSITIRVHDLGAGPFARSRPNGVGTTRSMQLVQCVAQSWGVSVINDGRQMWAVLCYPRGGR
jgi:hypothetical protein